MNKTFPLRHLCGRFVLCALLLIFSAFVSSAFGGDQSQCGDGTCQFWDHSENCLTCPADCSCAPSDECAPDDRKANSVGCSPTMWFADDYPGADCEGVVCNTYCDGRVIHYNGTCLEDALGMCDYSTIECPFGCDNTSMSCKEDPCNGPGRIECPSKCEHATFMYNGSCRGTYTGEMYCSYASIICTCSEDGSSCRGGINGMVFYYDAGGDAVRLKNVKVAFEYVDENGVRHEDPNDFVWTDSEGKFFWNKEGAFKVNTTIDLLVYFMDSGNKLYLVKNTQNPIEGIGIYYKEGIKLRDDDIGAFSVDLEVPPTGGRDAGRILMSYGKIYANVLKAVEFKENVLKFTPTTRERVEVYSNKGTSHLGEVYAADFPNEIGMRINRRGSDLYTFDAPTNREFHEYCHHIQSEALNERRLPPGLDHGGYQANPSSEWGFIEGWAEFCALEMKKYYNLSGRSRYEVTQTVYDIELNYRMDSTHLRKNTEEIAIAGILLDLRDSTSDYGGHDDDFVSLPLSDIWSAVSGEFNFGDGLGARHVYTLRDFYLALKRVTVNNTLVNEPYGRGGSRTNLDEIFTRHGAFQDSNNNGVWDEGEEVGYSGKGNRLREDLEAEPGTEVVVDVRDKEGNPVKEKVFAVVDVKFEPPYEYLSYSFELPVENGSVAIPAPPEEYNATITITAKQGGTTQLAETSFVTTTQEVYEKLDPEKPFGTYSTELEVKPVPCANNMYCEFLGAGNHCYGVCVFKCNSSGECTQGMECVTGTCVQECSSSSDCKEGMKCVNEACMECSSNSDCKQGFTCAMGACVQCSRDAYCKQGLKCVNGMCVQCSSNEDCKSYKCVDGFCEGEEAVETEKTEGGDEKPSGCCCSCFGLIIPTLTALAGVTLKNMA